MRNRPRLRCLAWPRPRLAITDTPRPNCPDCCGYGWFQAGQPGAEEPDTFPCDCWNYGYERTLIRLPRFRFRRQPAVSDEPPF